MTVMIDMNMNDKSIEDTSDISLSPSSTTSIYNPEHIEQNVINNTLHQPSYTLNTFDTIPLQLPSLVPEPLSCMQFFTSLSCLAKLFILFILCLWISIFLIMNWKAGILCSILWLPLLYIYRLYRLHYDIIEHEFLVRLFAAGFLPAAISVLFVQVLLSILFAFICFYDELQAIEVSLIPKDPTNTIIPDFIQLPILHQFIYHHIIPSVIVTSPISSSFISDTPMVAMSTSSLSYFNETISNFDASSLISNSTGKPNFYIFLFLLSYVVASFTEECMKYVCIKRIQKYRPYYHEIPGMLLYSMMPALGFSTIENMVYLLGQSDDLSWSHVPLWYATFVALARICFSTPFHCMTAYLIGMKIIRRDFLQERIKWITIMCYPVFFHGTFDFLLLLIASLKSAMHPIWVAPILMLSIVATLILLLWYVIHRESQYLPVQQNTRFAPLSQLDIDPLSPIHHRQETQSSINSQSSYDNTLQQQHDAQTSSTQALELTSIRST